MFHEKGNAQPFFSECQILPSPPSSVYVYRFSAWYFQENEGDAIVWKTWIKRD